MKNYIIMLIMFLVVQNFNAQDQKDSIDLSLQELTISTAPSVILLGISPSELEIPKSKKGIVFSLINSFKANNGIPDSYAFEVTPFWLLPSENMSALKFAGITENGKQNIFSEVKKASLSLGFVRNLSIGFDDEMKTPAFAFSVRSTLIKLRTKKNKEAIINQNNEVIKMLDEILNDIKNSEEYQTEKSSINTTCKLQSITTDKCDEIKTEILNDFINKNKDKYKTKKKEGYEKSDDADYYRSLLETPPLLALDFAGGYSTFFLDNKFSNSQFGKLGFWLTLNSGIDFTTKKNPDKIKKINFYGIARYLEDGTTLDTNQQFLRTKNFDFGGKAEFVYNRFSISYEYIYRVNDLENTFRSSGLLAYKVSDKIYINAAFGKNYGDKDNLISFLGLNWGLDSDRKSVSVEKK